MAGGKIVMRTGEALVEADDAWSAAEPEVVIGELDGPVGYAIANLIGDQVKVMSWYDNEMGYSQRLYDLARFVAERL